MNILDKASNYMYSFDIKKSPEQLFAEFENIVKEHKIFNVYLKENGLNEKLEKMQRCKRSLERRKLFAEWYFLKYQNDKQAKETIIDISEITFMSTKTIQKDLTS